MTDPSLSPVLFAIDGFWEMFHKAEGGIPPGSFFDGDSPQPADGAAIAEFLRQVKAMTLAQVSRVAERCEHVGYVGSQIDHYQST